MLDRSLPRLPTIGKREKIQRTVFTTIECTSCHTKTKQVFKEGDYVVKEAGKCEKCGGPRVITAIYAEQPAPTK